MRKALVTEIVPLGDAHREEIVGLFVNAFYDYPLFRILLGQSGGDYRRMLENIMQFWVDIYLINQLDVIGCRREGKLVAAAMIDAPGSSVDGEVVGELKTRLIDQIGNDIYSVLEEFEAVSESELPLKTHHFLGILAVDPDFQRKGFGLLLTKDVIRSASESFLSSGVCLTTEAEANVAYYASLGFNQASRAEVNGITTWGMVRDSESPN